MNDLYFIKILSQSEDRIEAVLTINGESNIYPGHFPGFPVTPGVCQLGMIRGVLEKSRGRSYRPSRFRYLKFTAMHRPSENMKIQAQLLCKAGDGSILVDGRLYSWDQTYLKLRGEYIGQ